MPEQTETERIRLEQFNALKRIIESAEALKAQLIGSGDIIPAYINELDQVADSLEQYIALPRS